MRIDRTGRMAPPIGARRVHRRLPRRTRDPGVVRRAGGRGARSRATHLLHPRAVGVGGVPGVLRRVRGEYPLPADRGPPFDDLASASAAVGMVFTTAVLITGPLWGRPVWGVYWTWDSRLTSFLLLWPIYLSYLVLRGYVPEPERRARYCAVVGIVGFLESLSSTCPCGGGAPSTRRSSSSPVAGFRYRCWWGSCSAWRCSRSCTPISCRCASA